MQYTQFAGVHDTYLPNTSERVPDLHYHRKFRHNHLQQTTRLSLLTNIDTDMTRHMHFNKTAFQLQAEHSRKGYTERHAFYSASALLAMQTRCNSQRDSICPSVRLSVTFRYCDQRNEDTIVRFLASSRTIL